MIALALRTISLLWGIKLEFKLLYRALNLLRHRSEFRTELNVWTPQSPEGEQRELQTWNAQKLLWGS